MGISTTVVAPAAPADEEEHHVEEPRDVRQTTPWDQVETNNTESKIIVDDELMEIGDKEALAKSEVENHPNAVSTDFDINRNTSVLASIEEMKDSVFFHYPDRKDRLSQFWMLLLLAAVIATSGIVGDSPATVIGAMIVAPLMRPILGVMLAVVLKDWKNLFDCALILVTGIGTCIALGALYGTLISEEVFSSENNSQIASRVRPQMTDFIGALATGAVGAVALVRKDIAGALPGVSISISLVPPLCVVGLTLYAGEFIDAVGALLLFVCNFMSIQFIGVLVMYFYRVHKQAISPKAKENYAVIFTLLVMMVAIGIPLGYTSRQIAMEREAEKCIRDVIGPVVEPLGWRSNIVVARTEAKKLHATLLISGRPPFPEEEELNEGEALKEKCKHIDSIAVTFIPMVEFEL